MMNNSSVNGDDNDVISPGSVLVYSFSAFNFIGLFFNSLVLFIVSRCHVIPGKIPRVFLLNQLINEWLCCLFRSFAWLTDQEWQVPDNVFGTIVCKLMYTRAIFYSIMHASYTGLVLLSVERYVTVVHPLLHKKFTPSVVALAVFLSWSTGVVRALNRYIEPDRSGSSCVIVPIDIRPLATMTFFWSLVIPLITIACLNGHVICALKNQVKKLNQYAGILNSGSRLKLQRELTFSVLANCVTYAVTVTPLMTVHVLMAYNVIERDFRGLLYQWLTCWTSAFYVINPIVCILLMRSIRTHVISILFCRSLTTKHRKLKALGIQTVSNPRYSTRSFETSNSL